MSNQIEQIRAEIERRNLANYCGTAEQYEEELFAILDTIEAEEKEHPIPSDVQEAADEAAEMAARRAYPYEGGTKGDICEASIPIFCKGFKAGVAWERERLASCPTIKGWVARDATGDAYFYPYFRPTRDKSCWFGMTGVFLKGDLFPSLRWEDEPKEVEIIAKTK